MKKITQIFAAILVLACHLSVFAQANGQQDDKEKKKKDKAHSYIEISGGISLPVGNFTKTNYSDAHSGFAGVGPIFAISGVKYIAHSNFGLGGTLSYAYYRMKDLSNIALGYQSTWDVDSTNVRGTEYKSIHALVGPYYSVPLGIVTIDFHALAGLNAMWSPEMDVLLEDGGIAQTYDYKYNITNGSFPGNQFSFWQQPAFSAVMAMQLGAGLRISPVKHFAIAVRVDYFYSQPVFNINWVNANPNAYPGERYFTSYTQPFNGINASLGLDYVFDK